MEFPYSRVIVQQAGSEALTVFGFEIEREESGYLEGYRPRTLGIFSIFLCMAGGETAGVWLDESGPSQTRVSAHTANSILGYWCQRDWTHSLLGEMKRLLGPSKGPAH